MPLLRRILAPQGGLSSVRVFPSLATQVQCSKRQCTRRFSIMHEEKQHKSGKGRKESALAVRMKNYEAETPAMVPKTAFMVVRADGHRFSKFTAGFRKPWDSRIAVAMRDTMTDALEKFSCVTGYTQSDEITLIFPEPTEEQSCHTNNGRAQKIASNCAGYISVRFMMHILTQPFDEEKEKDLAAKIRSCDCYFDARVIAFPSKAEVVNHMVWRSVYDCMRNSTSALARSFFGSKGVMGKKSKELRQMLRELSDAVEEGKAQVPAVWLPPGNEAAVPIKFEDQPGHVKFGIYAKKELYDMEAVDRLTQEPVVVQRSRVVIKSFPIQHSLEMEALLFDKYWPSKLPDLNDKLLPETEPDDDSA